MGKLGVKAFIGILILNFSLFLVCVGGGYGADLNLARMNCATVGGGVPAVSGGLSWTNCVFFLTAEANDTSDPYTMSVTDDYSAGDSTGTYSEEGVSITGTSPIVGSYSFTQAGYGNLNFSVSSNDIVPSRTGAIGFWYNYSALPTGTDWFITADDPNSFSVRVTSAGEITFNTNDGVSGNQSWTTTDAGLTTGNSYFVEILFDGSAGSCAIYVNNVQKTLNNGTQTFGACSFATLYIGDFTNEGGEGKWDNIMIFNTNMRLWNYRSAAYGD